MNEQSISTVIKEQAPLILAEIKKANSVLLHCHPSPDPDSVGSALAMKFALEQLGKKVTVIKGDSEIPQAFMHFPGASEIVRKNFFEVDLKDFDLFIVLDSARIEMVSRRGEVKFPPTLKTVAIDHHQSNGMFCSVNMVVTSYPANCLILYDLFQEWGVKLTPEISANLFIGIYADTGGFKYHGVTADTYGVACSLVSMIPDVSKLITSMENSNSPKYLAFEGAALDRIEVSESSKFAMSIVPISVLKEKNIPIIDVKTSEVSSFLLTVTDWLIVVSGVEIEPEKIKFSFRSKDGEKYDVAKLTGTMGGGGHKAAAGLILSMPLDEAKKKVAEKVKELYNL